VMPKKQATDTAYMFQLCTAANQRASMRLEDEFMIARNPKIVVIYRAPITTGYAQCVIGVSPDTYLNSEG